MRLSTLRQATFALSVVGWVVGGMAQTQPTIGAGGVTGRVIDRRSGSPLDGALVTLKSAGGEAPSTFSDVDGRFQFDRVPAGRYAIGVEKGGYARPSWTVQSSPQVVVVSENRTVTGLELTMTRGAAVSGVVRGVDQMALPGARVVLLRCRGLDSCNAEASVVAHSTNTDERGRYRFFGLPPGSYGLAVSLSSPPDNTAFLPTYYPGTSDPTRSQTFDVSEGDERGGLDIVLQRGETAKISGVIVDQEGKPLPRAPLLIFPAQRTPVSIPLGPVSVDDNGYFATSALLPGSYRIAAHLRAPNGNQSAWAAETVGIRGVDVAGVKLRLSPTVQLRGRILLDEVAARSPYDFTGVRIELRREDTAVLVSTFDIASGSADRRGEFLITNIVPGRYLLSCVLPANAGLWLANLRVGGKDAPDLALEIPATSTVPIEVVLTTTPTQVVGRVYAADGRAAPEYSVAVFPADAREWTSTSRRIAVVPVANDGTFVVRGLPPGSYVLGVVGLDDESDLSRALLDMVAPIGHRFELSKAETYRVTLNVPKGYRALTSRQ